MEWRNAANYALTFDGPQLEVNFATSGAGSLHVELEYENGKPTPGFSPEDYPNISANLLRGLLNGILKDNLSTIVGKTVRTRFELKEADLYSFKFRR